MTIIVDTRGGDNPDLVIKGCAEALREIEEVNLVLTGDEAHIKELLSSESYDKGRLTVINAEEEITNCDSPLTAIRRKKNSSLVKAYEALSGDAASAMITAGSTGAVIVGSLLLLNRGKGADKPALATVFPNITGGFTCLVDCGANVDCNEENLLNFARHGSDYMRTVYGIEKPKVALLSVGTEDSKGNALTKAAFALLKDSELNFVGNMEAKTVLAGEVDVIVTDGFAGNVLIKAVEGVAGAVMQVFTGLLKKNAPEGADISFVKRSAYEFMNIFDFTSQGGAILLGAEKPIVKMHGSANNKTVVSCVRQAMSMCRGEAAVNKSIK